MKTTAQDRIVNYLATKNNFKEVPSRSRKYRCLADPNTDRLYWVGKHGAVRVGKIVSDSVSITRFIHRKMR